MQHEFASKNVFTATSFKYTGITKPKLAFFNVISTVAHKSYTITELSGI